MINVNALHFSQYCSLLDPQEQVVDAQMLALQAEMGLSETGSTGHHRALPIGTSRAASCELFLSRHQAEDFLPLLAFLDRHLSGHYALSGPLALLLHAWHVSDQGPARAEALFPRELLSGLREADSSSMSGETMLQDHDDEHCYTLRRMGSESSVNSPDQQIYLEPKNWPLVVMVSAERLSDFHSAVHREGRIQHAGSTTSMNYVWGEDIFFNLDAYFDIDHQADLPAGSALAHGLSTIHGIPVYALPKLHADFLREQELLRSTLMLIPDDPSADSDLWLNARHLEAIGMIEQAAGRLPAENICR